MTLSFASEPKPTYGEEYDKCHEDDEYHRSLAGAVNTEIDYTVFIAAGLTLLLLLFVEFLRHTLDKKTSRYRFVKTVLDTVYKELSTLGIVEACVFIMILYYKDLDIKKEYLFKQIHFTLFYTAIFNACFSCLVALKSHTKSNEAWISSEAMDIDHYVEIRKEFEEISHKLERTEHSREHDISFFDSSLRRAFSDMVNRIKHPFLTRKKDKLLYVIRFHQIRYHFLKTHNLPSKFFVSSYLKRCEQHVLRAIVHISTEAWIALIGLLGVLYFAMGLLTYVSANPMLVANSLQIVFISFGGLFVLVSFLIRQNMKWILSEIMKKKFLDEEHTSFGKYGSQIELFFGNDPHLVTIAIQIMQFGFAVEAGILLVFWKYTGSEDDCGYSGQSEKIIEQTYWLLLVWFVTFIIFLRNVADTIPRYTICTSLGELVHHNILTEAMSKYRLEKRIFQAKLDDESKKKSNDLMEQASQKSLSSIRRMSKTSWSKSLDDSVRLERISTLVNLETDALPQKSIAERRARRRRTKSVSDGVAMMRSSLFESNDKQDIKPTKPEISFFGNKNKRRSLPPPPPPKPSTKNTTTLVAQRRRNRPQRTRSASDGVALMSVRPLRKVNSTSHNNLPTLVEHDELSTTFSSNDPGTEAVFSVESFPEIDDSSTSLSEVSKNENKKFPAIQNVLSSSSDSRLLRQPSTVSSSESNLSMPILRNNDSFKNSSNNTNSSNTNIQVDLSNVPFRKFRLKKTGSNASSVFSEDGTCVSTEAGSDYDDLPDATREQISFTMRSSMEVEKVKKPFSIVKFGFDCHNSYTFRLFDDTFGTILCLFLIGMRIENFIYQDNRDDDLDLTMTFNLYVSFWLEVASYILFIVESLFFLIIFLLEKEHKQKTSYVVSEILDVLLSGGCLSMLILSEVFRCCSAGKRFGENLSLGMIEPFTVLIILRPMRHFLGNVICKHLFPSNYEAKPFYVHRNCSIRLSSTGHITRGDSVGEESTDGKKTKEKKKSEGHSHNHNHDDKPAAINAWIQTIVENPRIAEEKGHFSSEILQAMLGIINDDTINFDQQHDTVVTATTSNSSISEKSTPLQQQPDPAILLTKHETKRLRGLSAPAQNVVMNGKLGKPMKSTRPVRVKKSVEITNLPKKFDRKNMFQLTDDEHTVGLESASAKIELNAPNAGLIRSMRRCERLMPPLLNTWHVVDVVITRHELIYLEVEDPANYTRSSNYYGSDFSLGAGHDDEDANAVREALISEKGGKGLLLCDVVKGRVVTGHINIRDITCVKVEHMQANPNKEIDYDATGFEKLHEYWSRKGGKSPPSENANLNERWSNVNEHRLRITVSNGNPVFLRFFSDLTDEEMKSEDDRSSKNDAILWCQTIARLRGPSKLDQKLPNFGQFDEIKDYVEEVNRGDPVGGKNNAIRNFRAIANGVIFANRATNRASMNIETQGAQSDNDGGAEDEEKLSEEV